MAKLIKCESILLKNNPDIKENKSMEYFNL